MFSSVRESGIGRGDHMSSAMASAIIGAALNKIDEAITGWIGSLINSLTPSAMG